MSYALAAHRGDVLAGDSDKGTLIRAPYRTRRYSIGAVLAGDSDRDSDHAGGAALEPRPRDGRPSDGPRRRLKCTARLACGAAKCGAHAAPPSARRPAPR